MWETGGRTAAGVESHGLDVQNGGPGVAFSLGLDAFRVLKSWRLVFCLDVDPRVFRSRKVACGLTHN